MPPTAEELLRRIEALERNLARSPGTGRHRRDHNLRDIIGALQIRRYSVLGQVLDLDEDFSNTNIHCDAGVPPLFAVWTWYATGREITLNLPHDGWILLASQVYYSVDIGQIADNRVYTRVNEDGTANYYCNTATEIHSYAGVGSSKSKYGFALFEATAGEYTFKQYWEAGELNGYHIDYTGLYGIAIRGPHKD